MMANGQRLIDANEALRMMKHCKADNPYFNGKTTPVWEMAHDCAMSCIEACSTVDAVEVVHGRWIAADYKPYIYCKCSVCGRRITIGEKSNYCPNCGAKMDEEGRKEE